MLIETALGIFVLLLLVRFFTSAGRYYLPPPFTSTVRGLTDWSVRPLGFLPRLGGYETAAVFAALLLTMLQEIAVYSLQGVKIFQQPSVGLTLVASRSALLVLVRVVQLYMVLIIAGVVCRWFRMRDPLSQALGYCYAQMIMPYERLLARTKLLALAPLLAFLVAQLMLLGANDALARISAIFR